MERKNDSSFDKIGPTAKMVAYLRSFSDIPYSKEISRESGAEDVYREINGEVSEPMIKFAPYWEARYKVTNRILREFRVSQVLEIAAGLSPRGLEMTRDPDVIYVVSDLAGMLEVERRIAEKIIEKEGPRPNLHFAAANALDAASLAAAVRPFDRSEQVGIITEGLIPYLDRVERIALARNVRGLLEEFGGVWIASDVRTRQSLKDSALLRESVRGRFERISALVERSVADNLFEDKAELLGFFETAGFCLKEYPCAQVVGELSSFDSLRLGQDERRRAEALLAVSESLVLTLAPA